MCWIRSFIGLDIFLIGQGMHNYLMLRRGKLIVFNDSLKLHPKSLEI